MFKQDSLVKYPGIVTIFFSEPNIIPHFIFHQFIYRQMCKKIHHGVSESQKPGTVIRMKLSVHKGNIELRWKIAHYIFYFFTHKLKREIMMIDYKIIRISNQKKVPKLFIKI